MPSLCRNRFALIIGVLTVAGQAGAEMPQPAAEKREEERLPVESPSLPSWADTTARQTLLAFVSRVTTEGSSDFVPVEERIAVFDNDGTLWCEKPIPVQLYFALDRVRALSPQHPEWSQKEPFASVLRGDLEGLARAGERGLVELVTATHAGNTTAEFERIVRDWISTARHPQTGRLFTDMVYQPMIELLALLRANGFKTYIVSGGGVEFMRPWAERVYGIPPEQVIGSRVRTRFEIREHGPVLVRLPELSFVDDRGGKPVGIHEHIGRRPLMAFGNSDGDLQMLQWTDAAPGPRLSAYVRHDDAAREHAYDREDRLARLDAGLDEATAKAWLVVSMKADWTTIFPPEPGAKRPGTNAKNP